LYIQLEFNFDKEEQSDNKPLQIKTNPGKGEHNILFDKLQREYLATRSNEVLGKMYQITYQMQKNYLRKYCQKTGCYFDKDIFNDKVEDATIFVIDKFLKKPDFYIKRLSAYAHFGMLKILFDKKDQEMKTASFEMSLENLGESLFEQINKIY